MSDLIRLDRLDVTRLAADYSAAIRAELTADQLAKVRDLNEAEQTEGVDHVHDFTDAGEILAECVMIQRPGATLSDYADEMNEATAKAKASGYRLHRILVACEYSGTVRDEFARLGHSAESCDILPSDSPGGIHHQRDVREILGDGYSMMIAHPPCTYLTTSAEWAYKDDGDGRNIKPGTLIGAERRAARAEALEFVRDLMAAPIPQHAIENPKSVISGQIRKADQMIQPYQYGHDHSKQTCLWLHNLPTLEADPADYIEPRLEQYKGKTVKRWSNQCPSGADRTGPSANRWKLRSTFFQGVARAMAEQWGGILGAAKPAPVTPITGQMELFA
jgi:hypothetical protein